MRDIWDSARESFVESVAEMIRADRAAGRAPDGVDAEVMAACCSSSTTACSNGSTLGGTSTASS